MEIVCSNKNCIEPENKPMNYLYYMSHIENCNNKVISCPNECGETLTVKEGLVHFD